MAGAKGERGRNFKADLVAAHCGAVMAAMHNKAPHPHRHQPFQRGGHPVLLLDRAECQLCGNVRPQRLCNECAQGGLIRRIMEINLDHPVLGHPGGGIGLHLEHGYGGFIFVEHVEKQIGKAVGGLLVAAKAHHMC